MLGRAVVVFDETLGLSQGTERGWRGRRGDRRDEALGWAVLEGAEVPEIELDLVAIADT